MSVFVDTSALYTLLVSTEAEHADTSAAFKRVVASGRVLATTNYVLVETIALLQHRFGLDAVRDLDAGILPLLHVHWVTKELHTRGMKRLAGTDRRHMSLVDCVSFEVMEKEGIREALALDRHFSTEGFRILPAPR